MWPILFLLITANLVIFANNKIIENNFNENYIATFVIALINLTLVKVWNIYFNISFIKPKSSLIGLIILTFLVSKILFYKNL